MTFPKWDLGQNINFPKNNFIKLHLSGYIFYHYKIKVPSFIAKDWKNYMCFLMKNRYEILQLETSNIPTIETIIQNSDFVWDVSNQKWLKERYIIPPLTDAEMVLYGD